jgi:hypothetical protein
MRRRTIAEGKKVMDDLLDGALEELSPSAPRGARAALNELRARLKPIRTTRKLRRFEREVETFLQSKPFLRAATQRYLDKKALRLLKAANAALKRAYAAILKYKSK